MGKVFVLSHAGDIDGVGCAALLRMKYGIDLRNMFFSTGGADGLRQTALDVIENSDRNPVLFITDLGIDQKSTGQFLRLIRNLKAKHGAVIWFDHHTWPYDLARRVASRCDLAVFGSNTDACACEIVKKYTGLEGAFVNEFVKLVHYRDFYVKPKGKDMRLWNRAEKYTCAIEYFRMGSYDVLQNGLRHIAEVISSGRLSDEKIDDAAKEFWRINEEGISKLLKNLYMISGKIAVGFATRVNSTDACARIMAKTKVDIVVLVHTDTNGGSMRSGESEIDGLAQSLGGGGREHTAGFSLPKSYDLKRESQRERFIKKIKKEAQKLKLIP